MGGERTRGKIEPKKGPTIGPETRPRAVGTDMSRRKSRRGRNTPSRRGRKRPSRGVIFGGEKQTNLLKRKCPARRKGTSIKMTCENTAPVSEKKKPESRRGLGGRGAVPKKDGAMTRATWGESGLIQVVRGGKSRGGGRRGKRDCQGED